MTKTYYATSSLKFNGHEYKRGDAVELEEEQAAEMLQAGSIQEEPVDGGEGAPDEAENGQKEGSEDENGSERGEGQPGAENGSDGNPDGNAEATPPTGGEEGDPAKDL